MKRPILIEIAITLFLLGFVGIAEASLIGDYVFVTHNYPYVWKVYEPFNVTVTEGTSDTVWFLGDWYSVNVEEDEIIVLFQDTNTFGPCDFNGLVVDNLDDNSGYPLYAVSIDTNFASWNDSRVTFDSDTVYFNWQGLSSYPDTYFNAKLEFVPVPTSILLLGSGLIGLIGIRRRFNKL